MKKNSSQVRNLLRATRGANMVEYIILVGLVALLCIGGYSVFGKNLDGRIRGQGEAVNKVRAEGAAP